MSELHEKLENHLLKHYNAPIDKNARWIINLCMDTGIAEIRKEVKGDWSDLLIAVDILESLKEQDK